MSKSKKTERKPIHGFVSIVGIEISTPQYPSTFEGRADRIGTTSLQTVLEDLRDVSVKLGHFPSREEYRDHGKHFHKQVVRMHGLQALAKMIGMSSPPPGEKRKKIEEKNMVYRCFNQELCIHTPPKKVPTKQTYCNDCKGVRGWKSFRGEYND